MTSEVTEPFNFNFDNSVSDNNSDKSCVKENNSRQPKLWHNQEQNATTHQDNSGLTPSHRIWFRSSLGHQNNNWRRYATTVANILTAQFC